VLPQFDVLTVLEITNTVSRDVTPCSLVESDVPHKFSASLIRSITLKGSFYTEGMDSMFLRREVSTRFHGSILKVRSHRKRAAAASSDLCPQREGARTVLCKTASSPSNRRRAAAASSDLCPQREGVRTVLCKTASSPSNRRWADAADQSKSRRAADICVLETDLPGGK
jgi:hypothetical protein